jgi:hypothetical protein
VYIADYNNHRIRRVSGTTSTAPSFTGGHSQTFTVCQDAAATSINALMAVADADVGQTETWTTVLAPLHGTLVAAYTTTSTGFTMTPTGLTYMPTAGYNGMDSFKVRVNDGSLADTTTVVVTVNPLPTAGTITGVDSVCPGHVVTLSNATTGGTWSSSSASTATISTAGVVTGVAPGTVTITYTVTTSCGTATTVLPFKVRTYSVCPVGVFNQAAINSFNVYPNPGDGHFVVKLSSDINEDVRMIVTNVLGEKIKEIQATANSPQRVDIDVPSGIYFFYASSARGEWKTKVVVARSGL